MSQGKPSDEIMIERTRWLRQVRRGAVLERRWIGGRAMVRKATRQWVWLENVNPTSHGHGSSGKLRRNGWEVIYRKWKVVQEAPGALEVKSDEVKSEKGRAAA